MKTPMLFILALLFANSLTAQESATAILDKAYQQAETENKNVLVIFHASWCGWCKTMDKKMNDESCKAFFDQSYVIEHLVVKESEKNKHLENPGAVDLLKQHNGGKSGIPFWLIFDKDGKLLSDSFDAEGKNIGCPVSNHEVAQFVEKLKKTSSLSGEALDTIAKTFRSKD